MTELTIAESKPPPTGSLIDPSLFHEVDGELRLLGSKCGDCEAVTFPAQGSCPRCAGSTAQPHALASEGSLWAFTMQRFPPKSPYVGADGPFEPYAVGYVDLAGEVLVESRLITETFEGLRVGLPLRMVLEQLPGSEVEPRWIFAFTPIESEVVRGELS